MAAGGASAQLSTGLAFFLLLKRRPRIGDGFTRVNEVEESLDPTLNLVGVDSLARLDGVGYSISIIHLISGEYDIGVDVASEKNNTCSSLACVVLYLELYVRDSLSSVFPSAHLAFTGIYLNSHNMFAISMALAILPSVWLRNLSLLSYLSVGGVVATLTVIVCLFWVGISDGVGFHPSDSALNLAHLPVALGLYGYCFSGHLVFANIYSSMKERSQFPFVLLFCFIVVTIVYSGVVATGFLMFGESTMSQFTLNMPQQYVPSKIAIWMMVRIRRAAGLPLDPEEDFEKEEVVKEEKEKEQELTEEALPLGVRGKASVMEEDMDLWA
ncbi:hypothetical protein ZWY2020_034965 [Hordeum vulgare]|nr:hypothetical protein ZWY2020_034965 [Hordeum vulgare]